jgi:hypothetical protein
VPDALTPDLFEDHEDPEYPEAALAHDVELLRGIASNPVVSRSIRRLAARILRELTPEPAPPPEDPAVRLARLERRVQRRSNRPRPSRRPAAPPPRSLLPAHRDDEDDARSLRSPRRR